MTFASPFVFGDGDQIGSVIDRAVEQNIALKITGAMADGNGEIDALGYFDPCPVPDTVVDNDMFQDENAFNRIGWVKVKGHEDSTLQSLNLDHSGPNFVQDYAPTNTFPGTQLQTLFMKYTGTQFEDPSFIFSRLWKPQTVSDGLKAELFHNMWVSTSGGFGVPGSISRVNSMYADMVCFRVYDVAGNLVISTDTSVPERENLDPSEDLIGKFLYEVRFIDAHEDYPGEKLISISFAYGGGQQRL